jgi:hypothetical protein
MLPDTASTQSAGTSTNGGHRPGMRQPGGEQPGHRADDPAGLLTAAAEILAGIGGAARRGGMDTTAALAAITAVRSLAAELEHSELGFIETARGGGATWSQIAAAMGARNRQTPQKRHADLARRCPHPPSVDTPAAPESPQQQARHDGGPASTNAPGAGNSPAPAQTGNPARHEGQDRPRRPSAPAPATADAAGSSQAAARGQRKQAAPEITGVIIAESQYELVRAPDYHETRTWHVLVGGKSAGLVRPTWRGERSRPGWEPVDNAGLTLPATGIGRTTPAGHASTRDAAAVSLLRALQRQQENERRRKPAR